MIKCDMKFTWWLRLQQDNNTSHSECISPVRHLQSVTL